MPVASASKRYIATSDTMKTPPVSSTANEFSISSPVARLRTVPVAGSTVPTMPPSVTNQIRPDQSGNADVILSIVGTTAVRS